MFARLIKKRQLSFIAILSSLLTFTLFSSPAIAQKVCKKLEPGGLKTHTFDVDAKDWSWNCGNPFVGLQIQVFNHTDANIEKIVFKGNQTGKSWGRNVYIAPLTSTTINANDSGGICGKGDRTGNLTLYYTKTFFLKDKCLEYYSAAELRQIKAQEKAEADKQRQKTLEREIRDEINKKLQAEIDTIRDNCVISKSKGAGESAMEEIRRVCTQIAKNPNRIQKWRWGSQ